MAFYFYIIKLILKRASQIVERETMSYKRVQNHETEKSLYYNIWVKNSFLDESNYARTDTK